MHYLVADMGIHSTDQTLDAPNGSSTKSMVAQMMPSEGRIGVVVMPCLHRLKKQGHVLNMNMLIISVTVHVHTFQLYCMHVILECHITFRYHLASAIVLLLCLISGPCFNTGIQFFCVVSTHTTVIQPWIVLTSDPIPGLGLITDKGIHSVVEMFDLSLISLGIVVSEVITELRH